jgi:peptidoglycan/LPS O-acetylase OafA/YrhL
MPRPLLWGFAFSEFSMTLFFTLSGFVITYNYVDLDWRKSPLTSSLRFGWMRFSRLYPLLLIFLILTLNDANFAGRIGPHYQFWTALHLTSVETWVPAQLHGELPVNGAFSVSWSISTEFMMYVMFAVFMLAWSAVGRSRFGKAIIGAAVLIYCAALVVFWRAVHAWPTLPVEGHGLIEPMARDIWYRWFFYQSPYFRIVDFAFGAAAAVAMLRWPPKLDRQRIAVRIVATAAVAALLIVHVISVGIHSDSTIVQVIEAALFALIMLNGNDASPIYRALSCRPLIGIGTISYSLYLMHPFIPRLNTYATNEPFAWSMVPNYVVNFSLALVLVFAVSFGCYWCIELPAQQALRRLAFGRRSSKRSEVVTVGTPAE